MQSTYPRKSEGSFSCKLTVLLVAPHSKQSLIVHRMADRTAKSSEHKVACGPLSIDGWLAALEEDLQCNAVLRRETTFAALGEKGLPDHQFHAATRVPPKPRSILNLPFAQETFDMICDRFQVHQSIVRTIARSDVPAFSSERVEMKHPAIGSYALECRETRRWG
jgi:hypothetical protein